MHGTVAHGEARYPARLRPLPCAPQQLHYQGRWDGGLFVDCLAVVGTRRMTSYGRRMTEALVAPIAASGVTIVSGFMYGIDATAHQAALDAGGRTIAVMPCGIDRICPSNQRPLHEKIRKQGLVLSQFPDGTIQAPWTFPKRNEVVAGLCQATLVIEGAEKSGALITAALARQYGRKLFAVPGALTSPVSLGPIQLLRGGASIAARAEDVLAYYGKKAPRSHQAAEDFKKGSIDARIQTRLKKGAAEVDDLARALRLSPAEVSAALSLMQLKGLVMEEGGRYAMELT